MVSEKFRKIHTCDSDPELLFSEQVTVRVYRWGTPGRKYGSPTDYKYGFASLDCQCSCYICTQNILTDTIYWELIGVGSLLICDLTAEQNKHQVFCFKATNIEIVKPENEDAA